MAVEILKDKGDTRGLGQNWHLSFLQRHPDLKSKISAPRSMDRILAQDRSTFIAWFDLFLKQKKQYEVYDDDVYNMDEKGVALGVAGKQRVIIPKTEKNPHTSGGSGSREWATATETCSLTGHLLPSWTIFKGVKNLNKWHYTMERIGLAGSGYHISTSENGWTDNELGQAYFEDHFNRHTKEITKGQYRILIVDGHDSHLTTKAIQYCIDNKIILLCLPPHATHMLQPLDVGCFGPLAQVYKGMISSAYTFGGSYNIDKCEFLEIWHAAREKALTPKNITSSWEKSGILQEELGNGILDRDAVLSQLPPEVEKPQSRPSTAQGPVNPDHLNKTPGSLAEVQAVLKRVKNGELSDTDTLIALEKLGKAAANAMAETTVTRAVNQDLVDATKKKETRRQQNREDGVDGSYARVMGREELLRRREFAVEKKFEAAWKEFSHASFAAVFSCNITARDKGIELRSPNKRFETAWGDFSHAGFATVFSCNITAKDKGIGPHRRSRSSNKKFEAACKEFSHAGFAAVFSCNITAKDRGINPRSFTKALTKSPTKTQLPLPLFTDSIILSPSNTPNSDDPTRKSPKKIVKKARALKAPPKAKKPALKAPQKIKAAKKVSPLPVQLQVETQLEVPVTTRSGRTVKRKIWE
jgi:DDE superfamily endonuclease